MNDRFKIAAYPGCSIDSNPYITLFYKALQSYGVECKGQIVFEDRWLRDSASSLDAIHIHWPEYIWRLKSKRRRLWKIWKLWRFLRLSRRLGIKRIWTVHNLEPHEGNNWLDRQGYQMLGNNCDLLICHSGRVAETVRRRTRGKRIVVMQHGNYAQVYPEPRPRSHVLENLGLLAERPMVCCIGDLRHYKGLDIACEAVLRLGAQIQLIIGGLRFKEFDLAPLCCSVKQLPHGILLNRRLSDQEFADIMGASEAILLPYRKITSSGALLAAWTMGRGVIVSDLPYFRGMLEPEPDAGMLFQCGNADALAEAIRNYLEIPAERRTEAALRLARHYSWDRCILPVAEVVTEWIRAK